MARWKSTLGKHQEEMIQITTYQYVVSLIYKKQFFEAKGKGGLFFETE